MDNKEITPEIRNNMWVYSFRYEYFDDETSTVQGVEGYISATNINEAILVLTNNLAEPAGCFFSIQEIENGDCGIVITKDTLFDKHLN